MKEKELVAVIATVALFAILLVATTSDATDDTGTVTLLSPDGSETTGNTFADAAATASAGGYTIKLESDVDLYNAIGTFSTGTWNVSYPVTLDLNGHTLTVHGISSNGAAVAVNATGSLTIMDSAGGGELAATGGSVYRTLYAFSTSVVNIESGTISASSKTSAIAFESSGNSTSHPTIEITGGQFESAGRSAMKVSAGEVTITDGIFTGTGNASALLVESTHAEIVVSGGTFSGNITTSTTSVNLTLNGGTYSVAPDMTKVKIGSDRFATIGDGSFTISDTAPTDGVKAVLGNVYYTGDDGADKAVADIGVYRNLTLYATPTSAVDIVLDSVGDYITITLDGDAVGTEVSVTPGTGCTIHQETDGSSTTYTAIIDPAQAEAEIDGYTYATFEEALEAAVDNDTIKLLNDAQLERTLTVTHDLTIDLNGKTLEVVSSGTSAGISISSHKLTITDSSDGYSLSFDKEAGAVTYTGGKILYNGTQTNGALQIMNRSAEVILDKGMIESPNTRAVSSSGHLTVNDFYISTGTDALFITGSGMSYDPATLKIAGGVIESDGDMTISGNGSMGAGGDYSNTIIEISGGVIYNKSETSFSAAIYHPQFGSFSMTDGTIIVKNGAGIVMRAGELNISGGEIITGGTSSGTVGDATNAVPPSDIVVDGSVEYPGISVGFEVGITGGSFESDGGVQTITEMKASSEDESVVEITGGTFISGTSADESVAQYLNPAYAIDTTTGEVLPDEEKKVAQVGDKFYSTITEAIEAAGEGDTVKVLMNNKSIPNTVIIDKGITIDLNGNNVSVGSTQINAIVFTNGSSKIVGGTINDDRSNSMYNVELTTILVQGPDTSLEFSANINFKAPLSETQSNVAIAVMNGAELTLNGASISGGLNYTSYKGSTDGIGVYGPGKGGESNPTKLLILGETTINVSGFAVFGNGSVEGESDARYTSINISGGNITSTNSTAIFHPQIGTLEITGGTITGPTAIEMRAGTLKVSGDAMVEATDDELAINPDPSEGNTIGGAAIAISQHSSSPDIDISIAGGTFSGPYGIYEADLFNDDKTDNISISVSAGDFSGCTTGVYSENVVGFIKGGTFSDDVSGYCADGWVPLPSEDGYTVYERWTVTFDVNGEKTYVYVSPGEKVPSTSIPKLPTETGFEYSWTSGDSTWDSSQPITSDITVEAVKSLVLSASISVGTDGMTLTVVPECAADGVTYKYSWSKDGDVIGSAEGASVVADGPGVYSVSVTATADNVDATVKAEISYRPTVTDPDEPGTEFDITHSGQTLTETTVKTETVIVTSSDDHTDIDMSFNFQTDDVEAKVEVTGGVGGGSVTITVTTVSETSQEVIDQIIEDVKETVTELQDDDVKSVDVSLGNVDLDWMIIKVPFEKSDKGYVHTAEAYFINETTRVYEQALSQIQGEEVWIYTQHNTPYVVVATSYSDQAITEADPRPVDPEPEEPDNPGIIIPPMGDDDYVPLPPTIVVDDSSSDDDEMVKVAACAAAAVAAAIIALILVAEYRKR